MARGESLEHRTTRDGSRSAAGVVSGREVTQRAVRLGGAAGIRGLNVKLAMGDGDPIAPEDVSGPGAEESRDDVEFGERTGEQHLPDNHRTLFCDPLAQYARRAAEPRAIRIALQIGPVGKCNRRQQPVREQRSAGRKGAECQLSEGLNASRLVLRPPRGARRLARHLARLDISGRAAAQPRASTGRWP
jgi:hypothetical protein